VASSVFLHARKDQEAEDPLAFRELVALVREGKLSTPTACDFPGTIFFFFPRGRGSLRLVGLFHMAQKPMEH